MKEEEGLPIEINKYPTAVKYMFWYAGYGFALSSIVLHLWQKLFYERHWTEFRNQAANEFISSRVCQAVMTDNIVMTLLFLTVMIFLMLLVIQTKEILNRREANIAKAYFMFSVIPFVIGGLGTMVRGIVMTIFVYRRGIGLSVLFPPEDLGWQPAYITISLWVVVLSSAMLLGEIPLSSKNYAFQAILASLVAITVALAKMGMSQFYILGGAFVWAACNIQWQLMAIDEKEADIYEDEPEGES